MMMGVEAFIIYIFLVLFIPKSPRWLLSKFKNDEARTVLQLMGQKLTTKKRRR
jgi:hypothetical protein